MLEAVYNRSLFAGNVLKLMISIEHFISVHACSKIYTPVLDRVHHYGLHTACAAIINVTVVGRIK